MAGKVPSPFFICVLLKNYNIAYMTTCTQWGWTFTITIIALVSKVNLLEWLSKFAQCWVPRESVLRGSGAHKATSTAQNLKVTLIEWLLKLMLLEWTQVFRPIVLLHFFKNSRMKNIVCTFISRKKITSQNKNLISNRNRSCSIPMSLETSNLKKHIFLGKSNFTKKKIWTNLFPFIFSHI